MDTDLPELSDHASASADRLGRNWLHAELAACIILCTSAVGSVIDLIVLIRWHRGNGTFFFANLVALPLCCAAWIQLRLAPVSLCIVTDKQRRRDAARPGISPSAILLAQLRRPLRGALLPGALALGILPAATAAGLSGSADVPDTLLHPVWSAAGLLGLALLPSCAFILALAEFTVYRLRGRTSFAIGVLWCFGILVLLVASLFGFLGMSLLSIPESGRLSLLLLLFLPLISRSWKRLCRAYPVQAP